MPDRRFALAHVAYLSAIAAARELGDAMRASFDLYRIELLIRMRWPIPADAVAEKETWQEVGNFIRGSKRTTSYAPPYVEIDPTHLV